MSEVRILIEGYVREEQGVELASPSTILIRDSGLNILVDPGANKQKLLDALSKEELKSEDIDLVFLTHYHLDHILNMRLFPDKDILDGNTIYRDDKEIEFSDKIPNTNIKVIETPGHSHEHACLLVETERGRIIIAGDVFWWSDDEEQKTDINSLMEHKDPYAKNTEDLKRSRKRILETADYIIPGHGKMFKVEG